MTPTAQTILVTGGTGYIGSHTVVQLLEAGHKVVILDNLCNSKREVVNRIKQITGKRDYIHVDHLAAGNVSALRVLNKSADKLMVNFGTGCP